MDIRLAECQSRQELAFDNDVTACCVRLRELNGQTKSAKKQWRTKSAHRREKFPACCNLNGRNRSNAESGRGDGLGRSENKRPETRRSWT
ncbi:hypothetical protein TNCV_4594741 [Trichonephila clavipes]|uniref:Uncharacterized protein n=1 Tax=Trichonephila clavipes TaxID=2585209 RepID=A0A8X6WFT2_TRICX|nr:hypothetical protein TNCV_4594741 [Trichonephila clavipes]